MQVDEYLAQFEGNADSLLRAARLGGLEVLVPSCPRWHVSDLLQHTTKVHHWIGWIVGGGDPEQFQFERPAEADLLDVFGEGVAALAARLRLAPASLQAWTIVPGTQPKAFWARRAAHETAIHRVDAELACGYGISELEPGFAADGIDELLSQTLPSQLADAAAAAPRPFTVTVTPLDANAAWTVDVGPHGVVCVRAARDESDLSIFGLSADLYRWVWNRAGDDEVSLRGDVTIADLWRSTFKVGARRAS